jgi:hypothetical protein
VVERFFAPDESKPILINLLFSRTALPYFLTSWKDSPQGSESVSIRYPSYHTRVMLWVQVTCCVRGRESRHELICMSCSAGQHRTASDLHVHPCMVWQGRWCYQHIVQQAEVAAAASWRPARSTHSAMQLRCKALASLGLHHTGCRCSMICLSQPAYIQDKFVEGTSQEIGSGIFTMTQRQLLTLHCLAELLDCGCCL